MIYGIGTDIVGIPRFDRFVTEKNEALFDRLFTAQERAYCALRARAGQHYALRFAAKEAFLKALGTGLRKSSCHRGVSRCAAEAGREPRLRRCKQRPVPEVRPAVAREVRGRADGDRIYLVAVTGWGQPQDRARAHGAGFDRHFVKPIDEAGVRVALAAAREERAARAVA